MRKCSEKSFIVFLKTLTPLSSSYYNVIGKTKNCWDIQGMLLKNDVEKRERRDKLVKIQCAMSFPTFSDTAKVPQCV